MRKNLTEKMKAFIGKKKSLETTYEMKSIDEKNRTVDFIMTSDDPDRVGDIVDQKSLDITHFIKAPRFLLQHEQRQFPIGKWSDLRMESNERGGLQWVGTAHFSKEGVSAEADQAWEHVKAGEINTVSIGFIPKRIEYDEEKDAFILYDCELLECSLVNVPANKFALAKELEDKNIKTLSEDEKEMLVKTANLIESLLKTVDEADESDEDVQVADNIEVKQTESPIDKDIAFKRSKSKAIHQMNKTLRRLYKK